MNLKYFENYEQLYEWLTEIQHKHNVIIHGMTQDTQDGYTLIYSLRIVQQILG